MKGVVVDASVALAWCFPDEVSDHADAILVGLEGQTMLVPAIWALEVANAVLVGERSKRLRQPDILQFTELLESLALVQDIQPLKENLSKVLPVARACSITAYDAAYLELAMRRDVPLATLDARLQRAAQKAGITVFAAP